MGRKKLPEVMDDDEVDVKATATEKRADELTQRPQAFQPSEQFWQTAAKVMMRWSLLPHQIMGVLQAVRREHGIDGMDHFSKVLTAIRPEMTGPLRAARTLMAVPATSAAPPLPIPKESPATSNHSGPPAPSGRSKSLLRARP